MSAMVTVPMKKMTPLPQRTATTCWYTCLEMMFTWKERDPGEIKDLLVNAGILWDDACKTGLKAKDYQRAAKALGLKAWGSGSGWSGANFASFCAASPVWVAGNWKGYNHNVVVIGASRDQVKFIDPWWEGVAEASIETWTEKLFCRGTSKEQNGAEHHAHWIGSVMAWGSAVPWGLVPE
ncbi:hypothetical protein EOD42_11180 [Rhodovarius crocodyli]|uniref:Peptidase C39-like domain-containing protein n=1 Tax=Rhodovarius crocodyli TaxID=1979269 RepID=A0A437MH79_9PROT|nr:papain-like cysteine protease family protein [Rhodovarius crocodyli]RVT96955.1 hypothetical protein EOD42_11180 [Rhodovarius crocodyli]